MIYRLLPLFLCLTGLTSLTGQDLVQRTFKDTRVINSHSVEVLGKRRLDIRITHRFGDIAGDRGGWPTLYGLENAADVLLGAEYGLTDRAMIGLFRSKGAGQLPGGVSGLQQNLNGVFKYQALTQSVDGKLPVTVTGVGVVTFSTAERAENSDEAIRSFPEFSHRFAYHAQLLIARKFGPGFSLQLMPGYTYRNLVPFNDENGIFSLGLASRLQLSKVFGLVADFTLPFSDLRTADNGFYPALGLGLEIETGGHVFQVNFTNATGIMETDYIPYTTTNWLDGEFRFGFTVSRLFNL